MNYGEGLSKRLRIMAGMISMGERISWGSDSEIMYRAADVIESLYSALDSIVTAESTDDIYAQFKSARLALAKARGE